MDRGRYCVGLIVECGLIDVMSQEERAQHEFIKGRLHAGLNAITGEKAEPLSEEAKMRTCPVQEP